MNGLNTHFLLLPFAAAIVAVTLDPVASVAQESSTVLSAKALAEIAQVEAEIDRHQVRMIDGSHAAGQPGPADRAAQQLMLYDKSSVNQRGLRFFCHMPGGFTCPVSKQNRTTGSDPCALRT